MSNRQCTLIFKMITFATVTNNWGAFLQNSTSTILVKNELRILSYDKGNDESNSSTKTEKNWSSTVVVCKAKIGNFYKTEHLRYSTVYKIRYLHFCNTLGRLCCFKSISPRSMVANLWAEGQTLIHALIFINSFFIS